ncbi:unnamed protein product [Cuscuta europaea]|uniref:FLZ-type domain-containing protein n=1 Tax=Cuscuta europaea TaxID=41803 RepID=A0A9P0YVM7_CUSEU|nr:unnamed protein product [Cuscuta europaea]
MKLGKRPRPAMPRTNTITEFPPDQIAVDPPPPAVANHPTAFSALDLVPGRRESGGFAETAHFLTACSLCKRRLYPGRDIYMYRGDTGFCSLECREQQMRRDERKEKCSVITSKRKGATATSAAAATGSKGVANPSDSIATV